MNQQEISDKELLESTIKGRSSAFKVFKLRYEKKLRAIFYRRFKPLEKSLSYSLGTLFEDFSSTVFSELLIKPIESLEFDRNGSIGGLIHTIAVNYSNDMWERVINHRSSESKEARMRKKEKAQLKVESELNSLKVKDVTMSEIRKEKKFDFGFAEFNELEVEAQMNNSPESAEIAENLKLKFLGKLSKEQLKIIELRTLGDSQQAIANAVGITKDQVRTHFKNIDKIAINISNGLL